MLFSDADVVAADIVVGEAVTADLATGGEVGFEEGGTDDDVMEAELSDDRRTGWDTGFTGDRGPLSEPAETPSEAENIFIFF